LIRGDFILRHAAACLYRIIPLSFGEGLGVRPIIMAYAIND
jgi:hypothetical protein